MSECLRSCTRLLRERDTVVIHSILCPNRGLKGFDMVEPSSRCPEGVWTIMIWVARGMLRPVPLAFIQELGEGKYQIATKGIDAEDIALEMPEGFESLADLPSFETPEAAAGALEDFYEKYPP